MAKKKTYVLCLDDSGTRHPTRNPGRKPAHGNDWFALGGILFEEDNESEIRELHTQFCSRWKITAPLHSSEIRAKASAFSFVGKLTDSDQIAFYEELYLLMKHIPALGFGCVVDRPGYNARYLKMYRESERWLLCKSAFAISIERSAKFVSERGGRLRVYVERSDPRTDRMMRGYYNCLKQEGMPFSKKNSEKYNPVDSLYLKETLFEFRVKNKTSPLMQFADLFVWPIAMGGYNQECRPYARLKEDRKLLDSIVAEEKLEALGIKYYCFDKKKPG